MLLLLFVHLLNIHTDDAFFQPDWAGAYRVVGPEIGLLLGWSAGSG